MKKEVMEKWPALHYEFQLPMRYLLRGPKDQGVVICLHGYQDHALSMIRRLGWHEGEDLPFQVLAVNAPFPVPIWNADGFKEAYSWYFRDTERSLFIVTPETTSSRLAQLVEDVGLKDTPKVIVGFSQGGFLAPYLGQRIKMLKGIIGLGSGYLEENYRELSPTRIYALHGDRDERITAAQAQPGFQHLLERGFTGEFEVVPGVEHKVDSRLEPKIRQKAMEFFAL
jgi:predicted esterase